MTAKVLVPAVILATTAPAATPYTYTSPTGGNGTYLDFVQFLNYGAAAAKVTVNVVKAGDSASNTNLRIKAVSIAIGASYAAPEITGLFLAPGDYISWLADTATSINGFVSGREL
jgi:hypothetical protein